MHYDPASETIYQIGRPQCYEILASIISIKLIAELSRYIYIDIVIDALPIYNTSVSVMKR